MNQYSRRSVARCGLLVLAVLLCASSGLAQQTLGSLNGTVVDPSGAAVNGATVTVTNAAINETRSTTTQSNGFYQIFNLPIGGYVVSVTHEGFETTEIKGIAVQESHATTVNASLKVGKASESVVVTANPLLNASDATNGYTLDAGQIELAPLATGSFTQLAVLTPGVNAELLSGVGTNAGLGNQPIWANGQRDTSNTFQVNGVDVTNLFNGKSSSQASSQRLNFNIGEASGASVGSVGGNTTSTSVYGSNGNSLPSPPPEFLSEIRVNASMYDAEQGATSGAQVDASTLTGTNRWHGQAYGTLATNDLNAAPYFYKQNYLLGNIPEVLENPALHRWTAGGTIGGPVWKDKFFFFGAYQHLHTTDQTQGISQIGVPVGLTSDRSATGLLSALNSWYDPTGATTHYSTYAMDPIAVELLNAKLPNGQYMIPSAQTSVVNSPNVTLLGSDLFTGDQAAASLDFDVTKTDRFSLKYYYQHDPSLNPYTVSKTGGFPEAEDNGSQVAAVDNTISLGPRINWEQRLGVVREKTYSNFRQQVNGLTDPTGGIAFPNATGLPGMSLGDFNCDAKNKADTAVCGDNSTGITAGPDSEFVDDGYFQSRLNPSTNVIFALGKHTVVAGGGYSNTQLNVRNLRTGLGEITTQDFSKFLAGDVKKSSVLDGIGTDAHNYSNRYYRSNEINGYVQDKYQILTNLSLTAGVRYDYHGGMTEKYGDLFNFDPSTYDVQGNPAIGFNAVNGGFVVAGNNKYNPTAGVSDSTLTGRQWGISPRLGFAWAPRQNKGAVIFSGGVGLYYDRGELFSYLSQPAGGGIGGPFGVTMAPPLAAAYTASNSTLEKPMGSTTITPPNANPAYFTNELNTVLSGMVNNCSGLSNQYSANNGYGCNSPFYFGAYDRANKLPYTINYTFKMQWQPRADLAVSIGYTGNRGRHGVIPLPFNEPQISTPSSPSMVLGKETHAIDPEYTYGYEVLDTNTSLQCYPGGPYYCYSAISTEPWDTPDGGNVDFRTPYPGYSPNAALFKAVGVSAYDSLEAHLEKRLSHHFQFGASYTWGHALDEQSDIGLFFTGDDPNHLHDSWASADFDRTHVFSASFVAEMPNAAKAHSLLSYATNDWKLTGIAILQSGEPYSLYEFNGAVGSLFFGNYPNLPNPVLPIQNPGNPKSALTGQKGAQRDSSGNYYPAIDPSQIAIPSVAPGQDGVPPCTSSEPCDIFETNFAKGQRNLFRQSAQTRLDISVRKNFHVTEKVGMEYQLNVFNVTNTPSFDIPQDNPTIGQACVGCSDEANYGQVETSKGQESAALPQLYVLPTASKSASGQVTSPTNFGSVTDSIGSSRVVTLGVRFTY